MKTSKLPAWDTIADAADGRRRSLLEHVRRWSARLHVETRSRRTPTRILAVLDGLSRPARTRIASTSIDATDRDRAEAAADDLWDGVAQTWALVGSSGGTAVPALEHVLAELAEAGRWLAEFPVLVAAHDREIEKLFET